jgi:group I intron endonuclease
MNNGIYKIINSKNGDFYVGSCASRRWGFKYRWNNHIRSLRKNSHHSAILQRAWNKYGEDSFKFEIIEECEPEQCLLREQYYLDTLSPKYNILKFAGNSLGRKMSNDQIRDLKNRSYDWMRGENNWNKDPSRKESQRKSLEKTNIQQYITEETYKKISNSLRGRSKTELHKNNISKSLKKIKKTEEHQQKINIAVKKWAREYNSGENNYFYGRKFCGKENPRFSGIFKFKNNITEEEFIGSKTEMAIKFGLDHTKICAICNGKRKSHRDWIYIQKVTL